MKSLAEILGALIVQILKTIGHLFLVAVLVAAKAAGWIIQIIESWVTGILSRSKGH